MQTPVQITFRDMPVSDAIEARCLTEAEKLERYFNGIIGCHVTIAETHRRHRQGNLFEIHVNVTVPGKELVVNREPPAQQADEDIDVALRDAFDRMRRQLKTYADRLHGQVKNHEHARP